MRFVPSRLAPVAAAALLPASAFAVDYMNADQAARALFPQADRFDAVEVAPDAATLRAIEAAGVRARSARWMLRRAWRGDALLGSVVADEVIGKFELIGYAVGVGTDGVARGIEILSYRESHGHEVRLPAWRRQFAGRTAASAITVGEDIANISGATLSCRHVTEGVKRIVVVLDVLRRAGVEA